MKIKNNKGNILLIVFLVILVLTIFGAALMWLSVNDSNVARRQRITTIAFNVAEAGIERAIYDLRQDFISDPTPSWADGLINGIDVTPAGPSTTQFYPLPYDVSSSGSVGGRYSVELKNDTAVNAIWVRSTGTFEGESQTIETYLKMMRISIWGNAIFAGAGASGALINGNVDIRGSVHVLGEGLTPSDYAIDLGGTAELVGNNYNGLAAYLASKVPPLPTTFFSGQNISTLNAELRVKHGKVGLSGAASVGELDNPSNGVKETVDGSYVTDGFGGTAGPGAVFSDNGWSNGYDLGDLVNFPSLSDPYPGDPMNRTYQQYIHDHSIVISNPADLAVLSNITPNSLFSYNDGTNIISMDGNGNLFIQGQVYIDGGNLNMYKAGSNKTINYTGTGSILVTGNAQFNVNLITPGNNSYPNNIIGIMTPNSIGFNEAQIDVMGLFYGENSIVSQKQTDVLGTFVSNYFDMGSNVPKIYQVPETVDHLPPGMIGNDPVWFMKVVSWRKL